MSKTKTHKQACALAAKLLTGGAPIPRVIEALTDGGYPTATGKFVWWRQTVASAAKKGGYAGPTTKAAAPTKPVAKRRTYAEARQCARTLVNEGKTLAEAAASMNADGFWGDHAATWTEKSVRSILAPLPTLGDAKAASTARGANDGIAVPTDAETAPAPLPLAREPRRPLKRMLSADEWESMPEPMRDAVVAAILARLG